MTVDTRYGLDAYVVDNYLDRKGETLRSKKSKLYSEDHRPSQFSDKVGSRYATVESIELLDDKEQPESVYKPLGGKARKVTLNALDSEDEEDEEEWEDGVDKTSRSIQNIIQELLPYGCLLVHADHIPDLERYMNKNTAKTIGYACQTVQSAQELLEELDRKADPRERQFIRTSKVITIAKSTFGALGCFMGLAQSFVPRGMSAMWEKGMKLVDNVNTGLSLASSFINLAKV